jgi:uncharacterized membrane protein
MDEDERRWIVIPILCRWHKYFTFRVHDVTPPEKNVLRLPITLLIFILMLLNLDTIISKIRLVFYIFPWIKSFKKFRHCRSTKSNDLSNVTPPEKNVLRLPITLLIFIIMLLNLDTIISKIWRVSDVISTWVHKT